ncbi:spindle assembly checkpoint kinase [Beauveria bassiana ARSEF 2860]|uniref:EKC/KEOPS complex subunit BUD32 n=1 Tax=Beauveria bassiana (strain ARSEF 2860) TaxID=655819 RepID=J4UGP6_BEAB2|nr:spindle assembly checkpoint kinase [Beauveria bassiana ARSEF 2860]EJP62102.1 spindle assembly checkpoint kinase [Beauveria bassiana ARSEF 2860]
MSQTEYTIRYPCGLNGRDIVGAGITAIVARLDAVVKFSQPSERHFLERERRIYERLGHEHSGILRFFGSLDDALILQYARYGSIRQYFAGQTKLVSLPIKLRWIEQITTTMSFIHSKNVLHGDISCNNVFLDESLNIKIGDFAGSAIDDEDPLICYETSHEHPDIECISKKSELFALGSTFYEIMTGSKPFKDLADEEVCSAYSEGRYPELNDLHACNNIIYTCWTQGYASVDELLVDVKAEGMCISHLVRDI